MISSLTHTWGTTPSERLLAFPCDRFLTKPDDVLFRGLTIEAAPEVIFRWLCQMQVAPYSYDWIDNFGRQSPRQLTPGLEVLEVGQSFMTIFDLVDFGPGRQISLRFKSGSRASGVFGDTVVTYLIVPESERSCRLIVKLVVRYPSGLKGVLMRKVLPLGDLIMMRRQLLNFKRLAEAPR